MLRKIIKIEETLCNGCGICASACHEGAIGIKNQKAVLLREDYCDGLGDCLPACPTGAIRFEEREAAAYDEAAVKAHLNKKAPNWPIQLRLVAAAAPHYHQADLLIAADCTAFSHRDFHDELAKGRVVLIGCPKLDSADYEKKLEEILTKNEIRSVTLARMTVPCCKGIEFAARAALENSGKDLPFQVVTVSPQTS